MTPPELSLTLPWCVGLGAWLFVCGLACLWVRRNALGMLLGIELMLNAASLNFVAAARFVPGFALEGAMFALLVIALAAAEAALALAILFRLYQAHGSVLVDDVQDLKG